LVDFLDFELGDSLALLSVAASLLVAFSVVASVFFVLLFVEAALLFFSAALVLVALSAAGLFALDDLVDALAEGLAFGFGD
jgi:hypothetical protein